MKAMTANKASAGNGIRLVRGYGPRLWGVSLDPGFQVRSQLGLGVQDFDGGKDDDSVRSKHSVNLTRGHDIQVARQNH